jgi:hypothetical protein
VNNRTVLVAGSCLVFLGLGCAAPPLSEGQAWRKLERDVEGTPIFGNAEGWISSFRGMIKAGIKPGRARLNCRRAARFGPSPDVIYKLLETHESAKELQAALDAANVDAMELRSSSELGITYAHLPGDFTQRNLEWNTLSREISKSPISATPLKYHSSYNELCNLGFSARSARLNVRRAARFGPSAVELAALIKETTPDGASAVQAALNARHVQALEDRWDDEAEVTGYTHFEGSAEAQLAKLVALEARGEAPTAFVPVLEAVADEEDAEEGAGAEEGAEEGADAEELDDPDLDDPDSLDGWGEEGLDDDPDLLDPMDDEFDDPDVMDDDTDAGDGGDDTDVLEGDDDELPGGDDELPESDDELPGGDDELPGGDDELPGGDDELPESDE